MLEDRPDWCISRQRAWGTPIPLFVRKDNGQLHPETLDLLEIIAKKVEKQGVDAWFESEIADFLKPEEVDLYDRVLDTLDVWFDSGVTSFAVLERREDLAFPADIYLEGSDQYRGWFQTSLLTSIARSGQAPFRKIITHGFTVDEQGRKMSKSIGNVIEPQKVIEKLGADILRLWIASTEFRQEMSVSDEIFKRVSESYRRIRNTFRFLLANLHDFDLRKNKISLDQLVFLDRYILNKALILQKELMDLYEKNLFHLVVQKIHQFCSTDLGGFYLDIIKDRQYTCHQDNLARRSAQTVMHLILNAMVRWIAPILSFTAEEIWGYLRDKNLTLINNNSDEEESVFLTNWLEDLSLGEGAQTRENDLMLSDSGSVLLKLRDRVNLNIEEARNAGLIGAGLEAEVHIEAPRDIYFLLKKFEKELKFLFIVSNVDLKERIQEENCSGYASETGQNSSDFFIKITKSDYLKCDRCWHRVESVGQSQEHPSICNRCIENLSAPGEMRAYF